MARGDQFRLIIFGIFFVHSLIAFVIFAGVGKLLNYRVLKSRPVSWRIAGTVGVAVWAIRNAYVHAMDHRDPPNMDVVWAVVIPGLLLLGVIWTATLVVRLTS
jgi:phosphoglycerol transferase MdoB-like AlkP superfamily enzyme